MFQVCKFVKYITLLKMSAQTQIDSLALLQKLDEARVALPDILSRCPLDIQMQVANALSMKGFFREKDSILAPALTRVHAMLNASIYDPSVMQEAYDLVSFLTAQARIHQSAPPPQVTAPFVPVTTMRTHLPAGTPGLSNDYRPMLPHEEQQAAQSVSLSIEKLNTFISMGSLEDISEEAIRAAVEIMEAVLTPGTENVVPVGQDPFIFHKKRIDAAYSSRIITKAVVAKAYRKVYERLCDEYVSASAPEFASESPFQTYIETTLHGILEEAGMIVENATHAMLPYVRAFMSNEFCLAALKSRTATFPEVNAAKSMREIAVIYDNEQTPEDWIAFFLIFCWTA